MIDGEITSTKQILSPWEGGSLSVLATDSSKDYTMEVQDKNDIIYLFHFENGFTAYKNETDGNWKYWNNHIPNGNTLPGALEIYPSIMVENHVYEWRKGKAILEELPRDCAYYGEINHIEGGAPTQNCEFVSTFPVSGQIYTAPDDANKIYLCLTSDWLSNAIVLFDIQ